MERDQFQGEEQVTTADDASRPRRVVPGMMLDEAIFLRHTGNSETGVKILKCLEDCGLLKFCTKKYNSFFKREVTELYLNATLENNLIYSRVGEINVIISAKDFRETFQLPESSLRLGSVGHDIDPIWAEIRANDAPESIVTYGKRFLLKEEYKALLDIINKCVESNYNSRDTYNYEMLHVINVIMNSIKVDWAIVIFENLYRQLERSKPLVDGWLQQVVGYGYAVGEILKRKGIPLSKPKSTQISNYLFKSRTTPTHESRPTQIRKYTKRKSFTDLLHTFIKKPLNRDHSTEGSNNLALPSTDEACSHPQIIAAVPLSSIQPRTNNPEDVNSDTDVPIDGVNELLRDEYLRAIKWRLWRLSDHNSLAETIGKQSFIEENFVLEWLGTRDLVKATRLSFIKSCYLLKVAQNRRKDKAACTQEEATSTANI